jgi:hypothetical protein
MGLLDPKSRVLDVVLTEQGREALARNALKIAYYSVTDGTTFYQADLSGSADATARVYSECAPDMPQDVISLLTDDTGQLTRVRSTAMTGSVYGGSVLQGAYQDQTILSGSAFASTAGLILSSSIDNLRNNFVIGTVDEFFEDEEFKLGPNRVDFSLSTDPDPSNVRTANVSTLESFFQDPLLSHVPNFQYLPPVNKSRSSEVPPDALGNYSALGGNITMGFDDVKREMAQARNGGNLRTFKFDPAPRTNNVHLQFFEQGSGGMTKLDVIDFGTYRGDGGAPVRVLFVGKVYWDDFDVETFVRLFTVTLE